MSRDQRQRLPGVGGVFECVLAMLASRIEIIGQLVISGPEQARLGAAEYRLTPVQPPVIWLRSQSTASSGSPASSLDAATSRIIFEAGQRSLLPGSVNVPSGSSARTRSSTSPHFPCGARSSPYRRRPLRSGCGTRSRRSLCGIRVLLRHPSSQSAYPHARCFEEDDIWTIRPQQQHPKCPRIAFQSARSSTIFDQSGNRARFRYTSFKPRGERSHVKVALRRPECRNRAIEGLSCRPNPVLL